MNTDNMLKVVAQSIEKNRLIDGKKPVLVALSGGADSVALLDILQKLGYRCVAAHCNFGLRGAESDTDEQFAVQLCAEKNVLLYRQHFETAQFAADQKISIEMAARQLRYQWFDSLLHSIGAQAVAVAHHADDNIETLFLNLIRSTGIKGLCGMPVKNGNIIRPLLEVSKTDILKYMKVNRLNFVTDSTNLNTDIYRNKIRHEVIPLLQTLNPALKNTLLTEMQHFSGIFKVYEDMMEKIEQDIVSAEKNAIKINLIKLLQVADVATVLFELLRKYSFNSAQVAQISETLPNESGKIFYSPTHKLVKDRAFLILSLIDSNPSKDRYLIYFEDLKISSPIQLQWKTYSNSNQLHIIKNKNVIQIDSEKVKFPLELRRWQKGDIFYPFGMTQPKKLSNFFIDSKLSLSDKENIWLLCSEDKIVWLTGLRLDNRFRIDENTQEILEINYTPAV